MGARTAPEISQTPLRHGERTDGETLLKPVPKSHRGDQPTSHSKNRFRTRPRQSIAGLHGPHTAYGFLLRILIELMGEEN